MKIVLTCGQSHSGYQLAHRVLLSAGLAEGKPSRRESMSFEELHEDIFEAHELGLAGPEAEAQIAPGKVWEDLAVDLFMGNLDQKSWGWSDARAIWLLEFWKAFDPQIRFMFVYSAPEYAVGQILQNKAATPDTINRAIDSWMTTNAEILRFYNRNPGRCILVNISTAINSPARFVEKAVAVFDLHIGDPDTHYELDRSVVPAIASSLAKALIDDCDEAMALYRELESTADLDGPTASTTSAEKYQASREYVDLLSSLEQMAKKAHEHSEHVRRLHQKREEAEQKIAETKEDADRNRVKLEQALAQAAEQTAVQEMQISELQRSRYELANTRDEQTRIADELRVQQNLLNSEIAQLRPHEQLLAQVNQKLEEQEVKLQEVQSFKNTTRAEGMQLQSARKELERENELLLLQVRLLQEELEYYFQQYQQVANNRQHSADQTETQPIAWFNCQPVEITYDLRHEFEGDNWYDAEEDGRWAGPGEVSSLKVPALGAGSYEVQLTVVDAMEPEILSGMEVLLNGTMIGISVDLQGYPTVVQTRFTTQNIADSPTWEFQFKFQKLVSPAQNGSEDRRILAIRLRSLKLCVIGC